MGEILRAIQNNTILIRNSVSMKVLEEYKQLIKSKKRELEFRGVNTIKLELEN